MLKTVGEVARIAKISVRTLHHYDEVGLLSPSGRSEANYRLYTADDLGRLHQILVYRALGFALSEIRDVLDAPDFDRTRALRRQRDLLAERMRRDRGLLTALDTLLTALEGGRTMSDQELRELFDGFDPAEHEEEVRREWGDTPQYRQSQERTSRYKKADWTRMKDETAELYAAYVALMDEGVAPESARAHEVAERHRALITRWFYDCTPEMLEGLSHLWIGDPRFTKNIDKTRVGLAAYQSAAARSYVASLRVAR